jgi:hypothetical protein
MSKQKLVKLLLTGATLSLSACTSFPKLHPYALSVQNSKCGEYEIVSQTDACNIVYKFKEWHPLSYCEGFFALPPEDIKALKTYQAQQCTNPQLIEIK